MLPPKGGTPSLFPSSSSQLQPNNYTPDDHQTPPQAYQAKSLSTRVTFITRTNNPGRCQTREVVFSLAMLVAWKSSSIGESDDPHVVSTSPPTPGTRKLHLAYEIPEGTAYRTYRTRFWSNNLLHQWLASWTKCRSWLTENLRSKE